MSEIKYPVTFVKEPGWYGIYEIQDADGIEIREEDVVRLLNRGHAAEQKLAALRAIWKMDTDRLEVRDLILAVRKACETEPT